MTIEFPVTINMGDMNEAQGKYIFDKLIENTQKQYDHVAFHWSFFDPIDSIFDSGCLDMPVGGGLNSYHDPCRDDIKKWTDPYGCPEIETMRIGINLGRTLFEYLGMVLEYEPVKSCGITSKDILLLKVVGADVMSVDYCRNHDSLDFDRGDVTWSAMAWAAHGGGSSLTFSELLDRIGLYTLSEGDNPLLAGKNLFDFYPEIMWSHEEEAWVFTDRLESDIKELVEKMEKFAYWLIDQINRWVKAEDEYLYTWESWYQDANANETELDIEDEDMYNKIMELGQLTAKEAA